MPNTEQTGGGRESEATRRDASVEDACWKEEDHIGRLGSACWVGLSGPEPEATGQSHTRGGTLPPPPQGHLTKESL